MADYCPSCGGQVRVVSGDEGTSHYEPAEEGDLRIELDLMTKDRDRCRDALQSLQGALEAEIERQRRDAELVKSLPLPWSIRSELADRLQALLDASKEGE